MQNELIEKCHSVGQGFVESSKPGILVLECNTIERKVGYFENRIASQVGFAGRRIRIVETKGSKGHAETIGLQVVITPHALLWRLEHVSSSVYPCEHFAIFEMNGSNLYKTTTNYPTTHSNVAEQSELRAMTKKKGKK